LGYDTRLIVNTTEDLPEMPRKIITADWCDLSVLMPLLKDFGKVIIDSYEADLCVYETIGANCSVALYIDDYMRLEYPKGIVVNPSLHGGKMPYRKKSGVQYFGGTNYVIVRPEFQNVPRINRNNDRNRILITMGGSDILNLTPLILDSLSKEVPSIQKYVVIGPGFVDTNEIEKAADANTKLYHSLTASQMRGLMLQVDVAITAAGQTIYELMSCGVPMIPVKVAANQKWNVMGLLEHGITCLDAFETNFNHIRWKNLIKKAVEYQPLSFFGQKEIMKTLVGA